MKEHIKQIGEIANQIEVRLYHKVIDLENHMSECDCPIGESCWYDFVNTVPHNEIHKFCLNCGGYIDASDLEDI